MAVSTAAKPQISDGSNKRSRKSTAKRVGKTPKRNRWATTERINNLKRLIEHFRGSDSAGGSPRELEAGDVAAFLNFTKSGVRKYLAELAEAGVIKQVMRGETILKPGRPVYLITHDETVIQKFASMLDDPEYAGRKRAASSGRQMALPPGCRIYGPKDDGPYTPRRDVRPAWRHPMDAAFFGPARVSA